jgi:prepilin-type N-terminal cleavage/methylation domain-containing protein
VGHNVVQNQKKSSKGFTIVELLIVIVVIGILAALVLNSFRGVQERARDTKRRTDVNAQASQLEVYYTDNGGYPVFTGQVNTDSWLTANLKGRRS